MERMMHESRETLSALMIFSCLAAGIGGAVFYTLGPDGWLVGMVRAPCCRIRISRPWSPCWR
jgi:hypothetical protein